MKKIVLITVVLIACFSVAQAQDAQKCPCLMNNDIDALYAVAEQNDPPFNIDQEPITEAAKAIVSLGLKVYDAIPDASYVLKVTANGRSKYTTVPSCQMALERTYDLLRKPGVQEVRIISEYPTMNGSCRNRSYTPRDLDEVKKRRDGNFGGRL